MSRKVAWVTMSILAVLVALYALSAALVPPLRGGFVVDLVAKGPARAVAHMMLGGLALGFGAFQFSNRIRIERPRLHRRLGMVYVLTVTVSGTAALLMAPFSDGGLTGHYGFGMLAVLWLTTTGMAYAKVRAHDYEAHREWMIRSYALCLAAVTLRVYLPVSAIAGIPFDEAYPVISWLCWVPNIIVAEWLFVRSSFVSLEATV